MDSLISKMDGPLIITPNYNPDSMMREIPFMWTNTDCLWYYLN